MFTNISWKEYFAGVAALSGIYYSFIGIRYYLKKLFHRIGQQKEIPNQSLSEGTDDQQFGNNILEKELSLQAEQLISLLKKNIVHAAGQESFGEDFRNLMRQTLSLYPELNKLPYRQTINKIIIAQCNKYSLDALSEAEVDKWREE